MTPCCRNCRRWSPDMYFWYYHGAKQKWVRWYGCEYHSGTRIWPDETTCNDYTPKEVKDAKSVRQTV